MEVISKGSVNATKQYSESTTLGQILDDFQIKETRLCVVINGKYHPTLNENFVVTKNDVVFVYPEFKGRTGFKIGGQAILLAAALAAGGLGAPAAAGSAGGIFGTGVGASLTGGALIAARIGILVGATLLVAGLQALAPNAIGEINGQERADSPTYSLTASGNSVRPYQPMALVLGTHNIFPDFGSRPYNEFRTYDPTYIYNSNTWVQSDFTEDSTTWLGSSSGVFNGDFFVYSFEFQDPNPDGNWFRYAAATQSLQPTEIQAQQNPPPALGDAYRYHYVYITDSPGDVFNNQWVAWEDLFDNGSGATFSNTGTTFTNILNYQWTEIGQPYPRKTEVVKQIMHYGFGDISYASNQIGTTDVLDFREYVEDDFSDRGSNETPTNWPIVQGEPIFTTTTGFTGVVESFTHVNGNVDTVDGGRMDNHIFLGIPAIDGFTFPLNWVVRQGPDNVFGIQVDIEGRQFGLDKINGGTLILTRYFNLEYRKLPGNTWLPFTDSMTLGPSISTTPYVIKHGSANDIYRDTVWVDNLSPGQYEVRGQRIDENESSPDNVSEIFLKRARFYQLDEAQSYVAQNRKSIIVESDSQLNGTLNKLSSVVTTKIWVNDGAGNYTWKDDDNNNPADIFLYIARGGYYNETADGTLAYPYSPTIGWVNSFDHPDNKEKIFGAGISDSRIDFNSLNAWWNFCSSKDLKFDAVLDDPQNASEVLKRIASVGRASPTWAQGKLGVVFEDVNDVPVAMFGPDNMIRDSFEYSYLTEDLPDEVIVNYMNPDDNWSQDSVTALAPGVINPKKSVTVDFWGITDTDQAQAEANLLVARQVYQRRLISFSTDAEGIMVTRGDVVYISHDVTSWDYESRIISTTNDGTNITSFKINTLVEDNIQFVTIRYPDNQIFTFACTINSGEVFLTDPWPLTEAPYILDDSNTVNSVTAYQNSIPEDFMAFLGERATPGKKVRITGVTPQNDNLYRIECIDEEAGFYAQEFEVTGTPEVEQYERIKAEVVKAGYILQGDGKAEIYWELNGAIAVTIQISINGSPYVLLTQGNGATIYGESTIISYAVGDEVSLTINPVYTDAPFTAVSQSLTLVLT